jgi:hypothetical protein
MSSVLTLSFDFQSFRNAKSEERKITEAIKGQLLPIRIRIATVTHAVTTSVAQIEFAASQRRQEVTKLEEKEGDELLEVRLCPASDAKLLMYRLTLVATLIVVLMLLKKFASRSMRLRSQVSSDDCNASRMAPDLRDFCGLGRGTKCFLLRGDFCV